MSFLKYVKEDCCQVVIRNEAIRQEPHLVNWTGNIKLEHVNWREYLERKQEIRLAL